jgi:hypothetical protein
LSPFARIAIVSLNNVERKSTSCYRIWALFDSNRERALKRDVIAIAEHGPPLPGIWHNRMYVTMRGFSHIVPNDYANNHSAHASTSACAERTTHLIQRGSGE